jgi:hypothetical protein
MKKSVVKKLMFSGLVSACLVFATPVFAGGGITVTVDGNTLSTDTAPQIVDGRTLVPLRAIFESLGAEIDWDANTKTVSAKKADVSISFTVGSSVMVKNGSEIVLDVPPQIINSRTMVPVRAVSEGLGCTVGWDGATKSVSVNTAGVETTTQTTTETTTEATTEAITEITTEDTADQVSVITLDMTWIKQFEKSKAPAKLNAKYASEADSTAHEDVRYYFEQEYLPYLLYNSEEFNDDISSGKQSDIQDALEYVWYGMVIDDYADDYIVNGDEEFKLEGGSLDDISDQIADIIVDLIDRWYLDFDDNVSVSCGKMDKDTTVVLLQFSEEKITPLCSYVALVFDKDGKVGYYTAEWDESLDGYLFCYVDYTDESLERGSIMEVRDSKAAFLETVQLVYSGAYDTIVSSFE